MSKHSDKYNQEQITQSLDLLKKVLKTDLLGVYLYGSSVSGGLKAYSDLDLFVVSKRETTDDEKKMISSDLVGISGVYKKDQKRPIELLIVAESHLKPWVYPPRFDYMYGEWLRADFRKGIFKPWESKEMPDLAILIPQLHRNHKVLFGDQVKNLLPIVPRKGTLIAMEVSLEELISNIKDDTRNVLLTLARIWVYLETDDFISKPEAANWALKKLPVEIQTSLQKAKSVCLGEMEDLWEEDLEAASECAYFIKRTIEEKLKNN